MNFLLIFELPYNHYYTQLISCVRAYFVLCKRLHQHISLEIMRCDGITWLVQRPNHHVSMYAVETNATLPFVCIMAAFVPLFFCTNTPSAMIHQGASSSNSSHPYLGEVSGWGDVATAGRQSRSIWGTLLIQMQNFLFIPFFWDNRASSTQNTPLFFLHRVTHTTAITRIMLYSSSNKARATLIKRPLKARLGL